MARREWLYGRQAVLAALQAGRRECYTLLLKEGILAKGIVADIVEAAIERECEVMYVRPAELNRRVGTVHHQGVALWVSSYPYLHEGELLQRVEDAGHDALVLILDHLQDPQNVGNVLRTAEVAGVTAAVLPKRRSATITPAVVNASAGAVEFLEVALVTNLARVVELLQERGVWVYALEAVDQAPLYWEVDLLGPVGLVVGSEGEGVSRLLRERSDGILRIPMWGRTSSLNAGVAGALALYEVRRQRWQQALLPEGMSPPLRRKGSSPVT